MSVYLSIGMMSLVPLKYPACEGRIVDVANEEFCGGDNEDGTVVIPLLLLIILLLVDNYCDRSAPSGLKVGASTQAAGAVLDDDGGDDGVSDSCDDGADREEVAVKPKPTSVDCYVLDCFFFTFRGFPKNTVTIYLNLGGGMLIIQ